MKMKMLKSTFVVISNEGKTIGEGKTPVEAAFNSADELYAPGSYYWYLCLAEIFQSIEPEMLIWKNLNSVNMYCLFCGKKLTEKERACETLACNECLNIQKQEYVIDNDPFGCGCYEKSIKHKIENI